MIETEVREDWRALSARLRPFVARRVPSADVDDVVQDVFERMLRNLDGLRHDERFGPWVYRVARSAVGEYQRRHVRADKLVEALPGVDASGDEDDHTEALLAAWLAQQVDELDEPYREAIRLTELGALTQREAAEQLGLSVSGMKSRVQRGRAQLRGILEACCHVARDARGKVIEVERRGVDCEC